MGTSNLTWEQLFGYEPARELKEKVLQEVSESGKDIREIASQYAMPDMAIIGHDNKFSYQGQRITVKEYEEMAPLGPFAKLIVIKTRE